MPRFYVEGCQDAQTGITIMGEDVNHIKNVLRLTIGDTITVCDGAGKEYECEIAEISKEQVYANIVDINQNAAELPCNITLFQGMPKSDKMEFIIQKAVELGAAGIVPVMMKRTVVKLEDKKKDKKRERYQMIAESAAKQSGRGIIPQITPIITYKKALEEMKKLDSCIILYEEQGGKRFDEVNLDGRKSIGLVIGSEGGFDKEEVQAAVEAGAEPVWLGKRILRCETAPITAMSILMFLTKNL